jgi:hypothetical protein
MIGLLPQIFRGMAAGWNRLAAHGKGPGGSCFCGWPLHRVEGDSRGWCARHGFDTRPAERGWPTFCPGCGFGMNPPQNGELFCPHCHWHSDYPMGRRAPAKPGKRKLKSIRW